MLSVNNSFIGTYCPDLILATTLAGIGGRAEESTRAWPGPAGLRAETLEIGLDATVVLAVPASASSDVACVSGIVPVTENVGKAAMDDAGGNIPRVAAASGILSMYIPAMTSLVRGKARLLRCRLMNLSQAEGHSNFMLYSGLVTGIGWYHCYRV